MRNLKRKDRGGRSKASLACSVAAACTYLENDSEGYPLFLWENIAWPDGGKDRYFERAFILRAIGMKQDDLALFPKNERFYAGMGYAINAKSGYDFPIKASCERWELVEAKLPKGWTAKDYIYLDDISCITELAGLSYDDAVRVERVVRSYAKTLDDGQIGRAWLCCFARCKPDTRLRTTPADEANSVEKIPLEEQPRPVENIPLEEQPRPGSNPVRDRYKTALGALFRPAVVAAMMERFDSHETNDQVGELLIGRARLAALVRTWLDFEAKEDQGLNDIYQARREPMLHSDLSIDFNLRPRKWFGRD